MKTSKQIASLHHRRYYRSLDASQKEGISFVIQPLSRMRSVKRISPKVSRWAKILEISYYGEEPGMGGEWLSWANFPFVTCILLRREWAGRTCWYPDLHSHLRLNLCLRPRSIVWPSRADCLATGRSDLIFSKLALPLLSYILDIVTRVANQMESFSKNIYMYIYISVGAIYVVDIEPVASCSIGDGKEQMGGREKKKKKERYRSVVEQIRNSA